MTVYCRLVLPLLLATALPCPNAFRPEHAPADFHQLDTNHDGLLTVAEKQVHLDQRFTLELEEIMKFFDSDSDGMLTQQEYFHRSHEFFTTEPQVRSWFWSSIDSDQSGYTDAAELRQQQSLILTASAQEKARQWLQHYDKNEDNAVTRDEFLSTPGNSGTDALTLFDLDQDNQITASEYLRSGGQYGKSSTFIEAIDSNDDGGVDEREWRSLHHEL